MSTGKKAVFLSYASEDADAAKRIAEALRSFGAEVWFDQNELRGGDQWDAHIHRQIKECALFMPIISERTQTREEGYFRREWGLADERTRDMGRRKAFLVPLCIDQTTDSDADVPDSFLRVQWTRLPGGLPTPEFVNRMVQLLESSDHSEPKTMAQTSPSLSPPEKKPSIPVWTWAAVAIVIAVGLGVAFLGRGDRAAPTADSDLPAGREPARGELVESAERATRSSIPATALPKSIAVLPLENRSQLKEDEFFTAGIHDDLLTQISRIRDIKTISRTSVMTYKDTTKNMRTIGEELGVATILEGGVQRAGNQVRINVQLIDAATDAHLWAETYTREMTAESIFTIQTEIAGKIADALQAVLSPEEQRQFEKLPTQNLAALEAFFKAGATDGTAEGNRESIEFLKQAIELDPKFAAAHSLLGSRYLGQVWSEGLPVDEQVEKAEPYIRRALELDDRSTLAHVALGILNDRKGELAESETAFRRAIELNPNHVEAHRGYGMLQLWGLEDVEAAVTSFRTAFELDPLNPGSLQQLAEALLVSGRIQESETLLKRLLESDPENVEGVRAYGNLQETGYNRYDQAIKTLRHAVALDPRNPNFAVKLALCHFWMGDNNGAGFWFERALALAPQSREAAFFSGMRLMAQGEKEEALAALRTVPTDADWHGLTIFFVSRADFEAGRLERVLERQTAQGADDTVIRQANVRSACNRAYFLAASGKREQADELIERILAALPSLARMGTWGYGNGDVIVYLARGDNERAIAALREFSDAGGCDVMLVAGRMFNVLREEPEFQELMAINESRLAEQRANLARMEANGELAPIPPLPEPE